MSIKLLNNLISLAKANGYYRINFGKISKQLTGKVKYMSLGMEVSKANQDKALRIANSIANQLATDLKNSCVDPTFERYNPKNNNVLNEIKTYKHYIDSLEKPYFETRKRTSKSEVTFSQTMLVLERECDQYLEQIVSAENVKEIILQAPHGTRRRKGTVETLNILLKSFPELKKLKGSFDYDLSDFKKDYKAAERELPSDEEVIAGFYEMQSAHDKSPWAGKTTPYFLRLASWGWVYGILATYGLRPHELLAIDLEQSFSTELNEIVLDEKLCDGTKTGSRIVYPLKPEWVEFFGLKEAKKHDKRKQLLLVLENKSVRRIRKKPSDAMFGKSTETVCITDSISARFKHKKIKIRAYDLRHAYAVRGYRLAVSISCMAKLMGHSIDTHEKIYQKYMTGQMVKDPYVLALKLYNNAIEGNTLYQQLELENKALAEANQSLLEQNQRLLAEVSRMREVTPPHLYRNHWKSANSG